MMNNSAQSIAAEWVARTGKLPAAMDQAAEWTFLHSAILTTLSIAYLIWYVRFLIKDSAKKEVDLSRYFSTKQKTSHFVALIVGGIIAILATLQVIDFTWLHVLLFPDSWALHNEW